MLDQWELSVCTYRKLYLDSFSDKAMLRFYKGHPTESCDEKLCWQNMLTSFVLWDDIYVGSGHNNGYSVLINNGDGITHKPAFSTNLFFDVLYETIGELNFIHKLNVPSLKLERKVLREIKTYITDYEKNNNTQDFLLLSRGFDYMLQSNVLGCNYLPHPRRAQLLKNSKYFSPDFDRLVFFERIDKDVEKYFEELSSLINRQLNHVSFPLLYSFISATTDTPLDELKFALELRNNRNVKEFRDSVDRIEMAYQRGNLSAIAESIRQTGEICDEITGKLYKEPLSFEISLGISPSLNVPIRFPTMKKGPLHTTFLYDLASFAVKGTIPKNYMH